MKKIKLESVFNEFTLMGIAVSGAFYLGEYWEGIAVILFYLIGEWFQHKAVHKARRDSTPCPVKSGSDGYPDFRSPGSRGFPRGFPGRM